MSTNEQKICFVIMGYGEKKDPETNRTINLDLTFKKIIKPAVEASNYLCVRSDEILENGLIDRSMFALLYKADLVIADISTNNPNALYELGIRHALRPYSTIVIMEDKGKFPFDLNHVRFFSYTHLGNNISESEIKKAVKELKSRINSITDVHPKTDSPLYTLIPQFQNPILSEDDFKTIMSDLKQREETIFSLTETARELMIKNRFGDAARIWNKLSSKTENDVFYIQQEALCTYKSELPSKLVALSNSLIIINRIENHSDTESLGISGGIYKRLWKETDDPNYLELAIQKYKQGWNLYKDYYTGENYANCLNLQYLILNEGDDKEYCRLEAKKTRKTIIDLILVSLEEDAEEILEKHWKYATLSNCYLALNDKENAEKYEFLFKQCKPEDWIINTFEETKQDIINFTK